MAGCAGAQLRIRRRRNLRVRGGNEKGGEQSPPPFGQQWHYYIFLAVAGALYEMR